MKKFIPLHRVTCLVYDFDGVMTNNKVLIFQDGSEAVTCNRGDGWAVAQFRKMGLHQCIISTETNPVVMRRAEKLNLPCIHDCPEKKSALLDYAAKNKIDLATTAYVGNDENDLDAMQLVALRIAPSDAAASILKISHIVTKARGGDGVLRELLEKVRRSR